MDESLESPETEKIIQVESPVSAGSQRSLYTSLAILAGVLGLLAFSVGFGIGKINLSISNSPTLTTTTPSAKIEGGGVYVDEESQFAISYPKKWEVEKHDASDYAGVKLISNKGSVDLWLLVDQPFLLGAKHQKAIESDEELTLSINDLEVKGTQFNYKAGNFFVVSVLPDSTNSPQVTFWLEADDEKTKEEVISITQSFEFLNK
jgi:hypothetical protein